jgi:hypothetical protein
MKEKIKEIIESEIKNKKIDNAHGIDLENIQHHLVEPTLEEYKDIGDNQINYMLWTVLEEMPKTKDGYKIVYDQEKNHFGLAMISDNDEKLYLGPYGSFIESLNAM